MSDSKSSSGGVGFAGLLTIAFVVLKLCKVIDWSWWWVLSPIWISIALCGIVFLGILTYGAIEFRRKRKSLDKKYQGMLKDESPDKPLSKWQQRLEEMKETQKRREELNQKFK